MWVTKLFISSVKKGFLAQKRRNLARNWNFCSFSARPCGSFGALLFGGCGARAVSRKTPIYLILYFSRLDFERESGFFLLGIYFPLTLVVVCSWVGDGIQNLFFLTFKTGSQ